MNEFVANMIYRYIKMRMFSVSYLSAAGCPTPETRRSLTCRRCSWSRWGSPQVSLCERVVNLVRSNLTVSVHDRTHALQTRPDVIVIDALEEAVPLDLVHAGRADAMIGLAAEAQDQLFGSLRDRHLRRKHQRLLPAHHLLIGLLRSFWAERRVACDDTRVSVLPQISHTGGVSLISFNWSFLM